jgi:hypothetical protein
MMMSRKSRTLSVAVILIVALSVLFASGVQADKPETELLGRWDLTTNQGQLSFPQWLEVSREKGELNARFMPRVGGIIKDVDVQRSGSNLAFSVPIPPLYQLILLIPGPQLDFSGTLDDGQLSGIVTGPGGTMSTWQGVRAPKLKPAKDYAWQDPIPLFNGTDLGGWETHDTYPDVDFTRFGIFDYGNNWSVADGVLVNSSRGFELRTIEESEDFHLHCEVRFPEGGGNSGIYLRGRYEVQLLGAPLSAEDPNAHSTTSSMGAIYSLIAPKRDATLPPGEWQTLDITLLARKVTVVLNGETIINNRKIIAITGGAIDSSEAEPGPILLQGSETTAGTPVEYRNIMLTPAIDASDGGAK